MAAQRFFKRPMGAVSIPWLLVCFVNVVPAQDVPLEEQCTQLAISGCYLIYDQVFWKLDLHPDQDGHLNNTAFYTACSEIKEKSSCHKINAKCPPKAGMDFTLQEKGYQLLRDFVCDIELFKDFQRALRCEDYKKVAECGPPPPEVPQQPPYDLNGHRCRSTISGWVCREEAISPQCSLPLHIVKASYAKARQAVALLTGCDYKPSAASSVAPQEFFLCLIALSLLRWMYAS